MKTMEQKPEPEPLAAGYRPVTRPTWRWDSPPIPPGLHSAPNPQRWAPMGPPPPPRSHKVLMPVPYREPQHLNSKRWDSKQYECSHIKVQIKYCLNSSTKASFEEFLPSAEMALKHATLKNSANHLQTNTCSFYYTHSKPANLWLGTFGNVYW